MLLSIILLAALAAEPEMMTTSRGKIVQISFDAASTWYLNVVFFEAVAGMVLGFAVLFWVFRRYGKHLTD